MISSDTSILGVFPELQAVGGVETAGRAAWEPLSRGAKRLQFCYRHQGSATKLSALVRAVSEQRHVEKVLFWHLGLLKLLPFLRVGSARVAVFIHGVEAWRTPDALTRRLLRRVSLFLTNTDLTWNRFLEFNPELSGTPQRTVHLGLGEAGGPRPLAPDTAPAALMLGRMSSQERYKGHAEVIGAWPLVVSALPTAKLWIAGTGDDRPNLERRAAELGVASAVEFLGCVSEQEKESRLQRARALALPSRGEGFGLVYLEAMRMGRPSLVGVGDGGEEVVNPPEAGLAVAPSDRQAVADALVRLLSAGAEWDLWSRQSEERYRSHFTEAHFQTRLIRALGAMA